MHDMTSAERQLYETPPRCSADASAEAAAPADPCGKTEVGFTLQTLIVMAVLVLVAVGAGIGLLAVTSSSSDDFEDAGKTGVEARCAPNEIWDPELESRGIGGPDSQGGIKSKQVGCEPYCGTWEYLSIGANENGEYEPAESPAAARQSSIGGPEGNGGVYSQNIGCFAPCYWDFSPFTNVKRVNPGDFKGGTYTSRLHYFDDNRAPVVDQFRLGVNYRRSADLDADLPPPGPTNGFVQHNDLDFPARVADNIPIFWTQRRSADVNGARRVVGTLPLHPVQIAAGIPTVYKPNWFSGRIGSSDPGTSDPKLRNGTNWEDENWEVRADPNEKVCTVVNITLDDQVVCSSEQDRCRP